eukprot:Clim_evm21s191 gene=Clim_evmTU21s191
MTVGKRDRKLTEETENNPKLWSPKDVENTEIYRFIQFVEKKYDLAIGQDYEKLRQWSVTKIDDFWSAVWEFTGIVSSKPYERVIDTSVKMDDIPVWFEGARLNYAENLLAKWTDDSEVAMFETGEGISTKKITAGTLRERVALLASALRKMGVKENDRIGAYIPNCGAAVEIVLATAAIGATWSATSPDFGIGGVFDRFKSLEPKLLFSCNAVRYNGRVHDHTAKLRGVVDKLPTLEKTVVIQFVTEGAPHTGMEAEGQEGHIPNAITYEELLESGRDQDGAVPPLEFAQLPFNHPLFICFSSGTTGTPKCMVHSAGGTLIKHLEEHQIQGNMNKGDILFQYTTAGWMMHPWLISALAVHAAIVTYDGSPMVPSKDRMFDIIDEIGVTAFGTSAVFLDLCNQAGLKPRETHKLTTLKAITSTGSPLKPDTYDYVYRDVKSDVLLASISGGTDIIACFMGINWMVPVYRGEVQTRHLGMAVECWVDGKDTPDVAGELVCVKPFPSMPVHFLNDDGDVRYRKAYFEVFDNVWAHGDFLIIHSHSGGLSMLGRSDGVLNPQGVRFGSAEIYNVVETIPQVEDSLCVGQMKDGAERVILFLKMKKDQEFGDEIVTKVKKAIRASCSPRHVPSFILPIEDIPYTINGKKVEVQVKHILSGISVAKSESLRNPDALDQFKNIPELAA